MQDMAELALEQGEMHYAMAEPVKMQAVSDSLQRQISSGTATPSLPGQIGVPFPPAQLDPAETARLGRLEDTMISMQQQQEHFQMAMMQKMEESSSQMSPAALSHIVEAAVAQSIQTWARRQEQDMESGMRRRMEEVVSLAKDRLDQSIEMATATLRNEAKDFQGSVAREDASRRKAADEIKKAVDEISKVTEMSRRTMQEATQELMSGASAKGNRRQEELEHTIVQKIDAQTSRVCDRTDHIADQLRSSIQTDMTTIINRTDMVSEVVKENSHMIKENLTDLRRMAMGLVDASSGTQDTMAQLGGRVQELRGALDASIDRVLSNVSQIQKASQTATATAASAASYGNASQDFEGPSNGSRPFLANSMHGLGGDSVSNSMHGLGGGSVSNSMQGRGGGSVSPRRLSSSVLGGMGRG